MAERNEIWVQIQADLAEYDRNLKRAEGVAQSFVQTTRRSLLTLSATFASTILAARSLTNAFQENFRQARELQAVSGLAAETADNLADTFGLLGLDANALSLAMFHMGRQIEAGGEALGNLGIGLRDSTGALKAEGQLFLELRDRIAEMGTASERSAALVELFGRGGRALAPAFALSREEFKRFMDEASGLSPWTEESQRKAFELTIAMNRLAASWQALKIALAEVLAQPAKEFLDSLAQGLQNVRQGFSDLDRLRDAEKNLENLDFISRLFGHEEQLRRRIELLRELVREAERAKSAAARGVAAAPGAPPEGADPFPHLPFTGLPERPFLTADALAQLERAQVLLDFRLPTESGLALADALLAARAETEELSKDFVAAEPTLDVLKDRLQQNRILAEALGHGFDRLDADLSATRQSMEEIVQRGLGPMSEEFQAVAERLRDLIALEEMRQVVNETFDAVRRGIGEMVTGVLRGTQTMEEAFRRMGQNIALSLVESIINRALKKVQEEIVNTIMLSQSASGGGGIIASILGGIMGLFGGGGGVPTAAEGNVGGAAFVQHGGILTRPTLMVGGEAGPEAVVPLDRWEDFAPGSARPGGGVVVNQVFNVHPGQREAIRAEIWAMLPMIVKASEEGVLQAGNRGGAMARAMGRRGGR